MATTGMRRGEVLGLRWSDVDLSAGTVTIRSTRIRSSNVIESSTPTTARGNRSISIGEATVTALRGWRASQGADRLAMGAGWKNHDNLVCHMGINRGPSMAFAILVDEGWRPVEALT
jgi:integrase